MTAELRDPRQQPAAASGVEGNKRLTAASGLLLIALLAIEGATILSIRGLITWHIFVGIALIGPLILKTSSTIYRFGRYYTGNPAYVSKGPPHLVLRLLGPLVILSSLIVLGTGLGLLGERPGDGGFLLFAHKASFVVWVAAMTIHVLGHLREALTASWQEIRPNPTDHSDRQRAIRAGAIAASLAIGVAAAALITPHATSWTHRTGRADDGRPATTLINQHSR